MANSQGVPILVLGASQVIQKQPNGILRRARVNFLQRRHQSRMLFVMTHLQGECQNFKQLEQLADSTYCPILGLSCYCQALYH